MKPCTLPRRVLIDGAIDTLTRGTLIDGTSVWEGTKVVLMEGGLSTLTSGVLLNEVYVCTNYGYVNRLCYYTVTNYGYTNRRFYYGHVYF